MVYVNTYTQIQCVYIALSKNEKKILRIKTSSNTIHFTCHETLLRAQCWMSPQNPPHLQHIPVLIHVLASA